MAIYSNLLRKKTRKPLRSADYVVSKSISRVLYLTIIYLGVSLPKRSSDLPPGETSSLHFIPYLVLLQMGFTEPHSRLCAGELLPHLSILTSKRRSISVALSLESPPLGITQHPALWSSDFPRAKARDYLIYSLLL